LVGTAARTKNNIYVLSEIGNEKCCLGKEFHGIEEWARCIFITLSKPTKEKKSEKCPRSQNQPTLYASIVNKESKQRPGSNQRNIQKQDHWKLCTLI
jgi:hypothetical protein